MASEAAGDSLVRGTAGTAGSSTALAVARFGRNGKDSFMTSAWKDQNQSGKIRSIRPGVQ